jgi:hypothetical protein
MEEWQHKAAFVIQGMVLDDEADRGIQLAIHLGSFDTPGTACGSHGV